jgi:hypothetical protein
MTNLVNCTPHDVKIIINDQELTIKPSGTLPRVQQDKVAGQTLSFGGLSIPTTCTKAGNIIGLPDAEENTYYIVSVFVLEEGKKAGRTDLLAPDTLRDTNGNIIGCKGFLS